MQTKCDTYKILGVLIQYPSQALISVLSECKEALQSEALLSKDVLKEVCHLIKHLQQTELLSLEENYVSLFDFKSSLSLHLLEHTYGDSRDRGQALLDIVSYYEKSGLYLQPGSMPDYMPVFLEHLSFLPTIKASQVLSCHINTIALLEQRLKEHDSAYTAVFSALKSLSASKEDEKYVQNAMNKYTRESENSKTVDEKWQEPNAFSIPTKGKMKPRHNDSIKK